MEQYNLYKINLRIVVILSGSHSKHEFMPIFHLEFMSTYEVEKASYILVCMAR